ncbi:MAG: polysaccharide biosynthesis/export family protein [Acidobacteriota bacterium]
MRFVAGISISILTFYALLTAVSPLQAQQRPTSGEARANLPAQPVGIGDLLSVSVYGAPELTRTSRVAPDGTIRLAMLKEPIPARGIMPSELEKRIAVALAAEQILVDPDVTVNIAEYATHPISVVGSVRRPLTFQITAPTTLLDALARAEGLSTEAGGEILITRAASANGAAFSKKVAIKSLIELGDPASNIPLQGGEEVRVPEIGKVFVVGNVMKPGAFPTAATSGMTLLKALALAEGLSRFAMNEAYIYRPVEGAEKQEVMVPLRKIMDRKSPDVPLTPGDILYVPDNRAGRLRASVIDKIVSFGAGTASGALILAVKP